MENKYVISPAPHLHARHTVENLMYSVIFALVPAWMLSVYFFGWGAILTSLVAISSCMLIEYTIQKFILKTKPCISDGSAALTGLLLAFNLPSNLPVWIIFIGCLAAISIAKMPFGGLGNNPFNPALVGRVFLLISFPVKMTQWPKPTGFSQKIIDAVTGPTPLGALKTELAKGESTIAEIYRNGIQISPDEIYHVPDYIQQFYGNIGGSLGEISALALLAGGLFLLIRKVISWHIPVSVLGTMFIFTGVLWMINPETNATPFFHLLSGGAILGAVFMATDYVTSPMNPNGMIIYGIGIGLITVIIRVWGIYPEGISFAILIMNGFVPLINRSFKPKRFGDKQQTSKKT